MAYNSRGSIIIDNADMLSNARQYFSPNTSINSKVTQKDFMGEGQVVAIVDSGFNTNYSNKNLHADVGVGIASSSASSSFTHGAVVGHGVLDIAPEVTLFHINVYNGGYKASNVEKGLDWAADNWEKYDFAAINVSLSDGPNTDNHKRTRLSNEVNALTKQGISLVFSASNDGQADKVDNYAADQNAITVSGSYERNGKTLIDQSLNRSEKLTDVFASVFSNAERANGRNEVHYGTSMSAPLVSGAIARLQEVSGDLLNGAKISRDFAVDILQKTGDKIAGYAGNAAGYVSLNADKAVSHLLDLIFNDNLVGNARDNFMVGGRGDDVIDGNAGNDRLHGGEGTDRLYGDDGADRLYGGDGQDRVYGGSGNDRAFGGSGNDYVYGGRGHDRLYGGNGHDKLFAGEGNDHVYAGNGNDRVHGGDGNDKLFGQNNHDVLYGHDGVDRLHGGNGNDRLYGGNDNDYLYGNNGTDTLYGGYQHDTMYGGNGTDTLHGGYGRDIMYGGNHDDRLYGGHQDDRLYGENGNDRLYGGNANDLLYGGNGNDRMTGGHGSDIFIIDTDDFGQKLITDLNINDKIRLDNKTYNAKDFHEAFESKHVFGNHQYDTYKFDDDTSLTIYSEF